MENYDCDGKSTFNEFTYTDFGLHVNDLVELDYAKGFELCTTAPVSYFLVLGIISAGISIFGHAKGVAR